MLLVFHELAECRWCNVNLTRFYSQSLLFIFYTCIFMFVAWLSFLVLHASHPLIIPQMNILSGSSVAFFKVFISESVAIDWLTVSLFLAGNFLKYVKFWAIFDMTIFGNFLKRMSSLGQFLSWQFLDFFWKKCQVLGNF